MVLRRALNSTNELPCVKSIVFNAPQMQLCIWLQRLFTSNFGAFCTRIMLKETAVGMAVKTNCSSIICKGHRGVAGFYANHFSVSQLRDGDVLAVWDEESPSPTFALAFGLQLEISLQKKQVLARYITWRHAFVLFAITHRVVSKLSKVNYED